MKPFPERATACLRASVCEGWWVPEASVQHYIPVERMTTLFIRQWYSGYGRYVARSEPPWNGPRLFGKPRWLWRCAVSAEAKYRLHRLISPPEIWIRDLIAASAAWGQLRKE